MSQALAARNIKTLIDEFEKTAEWFFAKYQREPVVFTKYNDILDRFEVTFTAPVGTKFIESTSYIEGPKLYDTGYIQLVKERVSSGLRSEIQKKVEESEKAFSAEKEIKRFKEIIEEGKRLNDYRK